MGLKARCSSEPRVTSRLASGKVGFDPSLEVGKFMGSEVLEHVQTASLISLPRKRGRRPREEGFFFF